MPFIANRHDYWACGIILIIGLSLRIAVVTARYSDLSVDTDAYLAIAKHLQAGDGFCSVTNQPTAYRPPLFPMLIAFSTSVLGPIGLAVLQVTLGLVSIAATGILAHRLNLSERQRWLAMFLIAVDPLLVLYSSQAMTEVLMTALMTLFLAAIWAPKRDAVQGGVCGVLLGLLGLCRPSVWPFAALLAMYFLLNQWRRRQPIGTQTLSLFLLGLALTLLPWMARNQWVFGRPILTTTHGGYTAWLGNNDVFFSRVVSQSFGTTWDEDSFQEWQRATELKLQQAGISPTDELRRDAAMSAMALDWINQHPDHFLQCAFYRLRNLWSPVPMTANAKPSLLYGMVGLFYVGVAGAAFFGLCKSSLPVSFRTVSLLLIVSVSALHVVYWANARMRAPVMPVIAILAAGVVRRERILHQSGTP